MDLPLPLEVDERTMDYLRTLSATVDTKGGYFPGHSVAVAYLASTMGLELGKSVAELAAVQVAALLHDTGKLMVPDQILMAPRPLTEQEWIVMRQHSVWSSSIAAAVTGLDEVAGWIRSHHERMDGKGYPDGLVGDAIPWQSRLLLIADAFHVMTTVRPYSKGITRHEAVRLLYQHSGTQFDGDMVDGISVVTRDDLRM